MKSTHPDRESKLETAISYVLIIGVIISLMLEIIGMVLYFRQYGNLSISGDTGVFLRGNDFFSFIYDMLTGRQANGTAIMLMTSGLVVLMLTPFVRVLTSVIFFGQMKNLKYVWITLFVLVVITINLALH